MGVKSESEERMKLCLLSWTHWKRVCVLPIQNLVEVLSTIRTTVLNALSFCFVFREPAGIAISLEIIVNLLSRDQQLLVVGFLRIFSIGANFLVGSCRLKKHPWINERTPANLIWLDHYSLRACWAQLDARGTELLRCIWALFE